MTLETAPPATQSRLHDPHPYHLPSLQSNLSAASAAAWTLTHIPSVPTSIPAQIPAPSASSASTSCPEGPAPSSAHALPAPSAFSPAYSHAPTVVAKRQSTPSAPAPRSAPSAPAPTPTNAPAPPKRRRKAPPKRRRKETSPPLDYDNRLPVPPGYQPIVPKRCTEAQKKAGTTPRKMRKFLEDPLNWDFAYLPPERQAEYWEGEHGKGTQKVFVYLSDKEFKAFNNRKYARVECSGTS